MDYMRRELKRGHPYMTNKSDRRGNFFCTLTWIVSEQSTYIQRIKSSRSPQGEMFQGEGDET